MKITAIRRVFGALAVLMLAGCVIHRGPVPTGLYSAGGDGEIRARGDSMHFRMYVPPRFGVTHIDDDFRYTRSKDGRIYPEGSSNSSEYLVLIMNYEFWFDGHDIVRHDRSSGRDVIYRFQDQ